MSSLFICLSAHSANATNDACLLAASDADQPPLNRAGLSSTFVLAIRHRTDRQLEHWIRDALSDPNFFMRDENREIERFGRQSHLATIARTTQIIPILASLDPWLQRRFRFATLAQIRSDSTASPELMSGSLDLLAKLSFEDGPRHTDGAGILIQRLRDIFLSDPDGVDDELGQVSVRIVRMLIGYAASDETLKVTIGDFIWQEYPRFRRRKGDALGALSALMYCRSESLREFFPQAYAEILASTDENHRIGWILLPLVKNAGPANFFRQASAFDSTTRAHLTRDFTSLRWKAIRRRSDDQLTAGLIGADDPVFHLYGEVDRWLTSQP